MTPKEKAIALVQAFINEGFLPAAARIAALIAVDEVLNAVMSVYQPETKRFWYEVKQEIEALWLINYT